MVTLNESINRGPYTLFNALSTTVCVHVHNIHVSVQRLVWCVSFIWAASVAGKIRGFGKAFELLSINRRFLSPRFPHLRTSMYSTTSANLSSGCNNDTRRLKQKVLCATYSVLLCLSLSLCFFVSLSICMPTLIKLGCPFFSLHPNYASQRETGRPPTSDKRLRKKLHVWWLNPVFSKKRPSLTPHVCLGTRV